LYTTFRASFISIVYAAETEQSDKIDRHRRIDFDYYDESASARDARVTANK